MPHFLSIFIDWIFPPRKSELIASHVHTEDLLSLPRAKTLDEHTYALFSYKDPKVTALIWEIKYHKNIKAIEQIAPLLADMIMEEYSEKNLFENWKECLLVPVPSTQNRTRERGYSHTELIAHAVNKLLPSTIRFSPEALEKTVDTPEQNKLKDRSLRLKNLHNTQVAKGPFLLHTCVFLIDDVTTTGATLTESRRALTAAGVKNIIAFTIAH